MANDTTTNGTPAWMAGLDMTESRRIEKMVRSVDHDALEARRACTAASFRMARKPFGTMEDAFKRDLVNSIRDAIAEIEREES